MIPILFTCECDHHVLIMPKLCNDGNYPMLNASLNSTPGVPTRSSPCLVYDSKGNLVNPQHPLCKQHIKPGDTLNFHCSSLKHKLIYPNIIYIMNKYESLFRMTDDVIIIQSYQAYSMLIKNIMILKELCKRFINVDISFTILKYMHSMLLHNNSLALVGMFYFRYSIFGCNFIKTFSGTNVRLTEFHRFVSNLLKRALVAELEAWCSKYVSSQTGNMLRGYLVATVCKDLVKFRSILFTGCYIDIHRLEHDVFQDRKRI